MKPLSPLAERLRAEALLLTGATGFLGKAVLEKLLRSTPGGGPVHVLVRPRRGESARARLRRAVLDAPLFDRVSLAAGGRDALAERVVAVEGDVARERLGLEEEAYRALAERVTGVINCSALCAFSQPLDAALEVNALGALRLLRLAADAGDAPLLHLSTCYVSGDRKGDVEEAVLPPGHTIRSWMEGGPATFQVERELEAMLAESAALRAAVMAGELDGELATSGAGAGTGGAPLARARRELADRLLSELGAERARAGGWGNVYLFSKALGEQLLVGSRGRVPLSIVRPSLIESTLKEPVPGWTDRMRITALMIECGRGTLDEFAGHEDIVLDLVPCDLVVNAALAALPPAGAAEHLRVYQVATSGERPLTLGEASRIVHGAFSRRPIHGPDGEPLTPSYVRWVAPDAFHARVEKESERAARLRERFVRAGAGDRARQAAVHARRLGWLKEFAEAYASFAHEQPRFLTDHTRALSESLSPGDREAFPFDPAALDWEDYLTHCQVPGLLRLQGIQPWAVGALRERIRGSAARARSVSDVLREAAAMHGERTALQTPGAAPGSWVRYSFRELLERTRRMVGEVAGDRDGAGDRAGCEAGSGNEEGNGNRNRDRDRDSARDGGGNVGGDVGRNIGGSSGGGVGGNVGGNAGGDAGGDVSGDAGGDVSGDIEEDAGGAVGGGDDAPEWLAALLGARSERQRQGAGAPPEAPEAVTPDGHRPQDALLSGLREVLANGDAVAGSGLVCVSRSRPDGVDTERLLAALTAGACVTVVD